MENLNQVSVAPRWLSVISPSEDGTRWHLPSSSSSVVEFLPLADLLNPRCHRNCRVIGYVIRYTSDIPSRNRRNGENGNSEDDKKIQKDEKREFIGHG